MTTITKSNWTENVINPSIATLQEFMNQADANKFAKIMEAAFAYEWISGNYNFIIEPGYSLRYLAAELTTKNLQYFKDIIKSNGDTAIPNSSKEIIERNGTASNMHEAVPINDEIDSIVNPSEKSKNVVNSTDSHEHQNPYYYEKYLNVLKNTNAYRIIRNTYEPLIEEFTKIY